MRGIPIYAVSRIGADGRVFVEETNDPPHGPSRWVLVQSPVAQISDNISFLGQVLNGPLCGVAGYLSNVAARHNVEKSYSRLADIGALYTAISGMLNLMIIVDAASRAAEAGAAHMMAYTPFVDPLLGAWNWWYVLLLPLAVGIALVYKAMRCDDLSQVPRQTLTALAKLLGAFVGCAVVLWVILIILERR